MSTRLTLGLTSTVIAAVALFSGCGKNEPQTTKAGSGLSSSAPSAPTESPKQSTSTPLGKPDMAKEPPPKAPISWADFKGAERGTFDVPRNLICLDVSPDGSLVAAGTSYGTENQVHLLETAGGKKLPLKIEGNLSDKIALSPDGKILALALRSKGKTSDAVQSSVKLWDISGAKEMQSFSAPSYTGQMAFSPDGSILAVACEDNLIRLWERVPGKEKERFQGIQRTMWGSGIRSGRQAAGVWRQQDRASLGCCGRQGASHIIGPQGLRFLVGVRAGWKDTVVQKS